jgi:hypothetical protein
VHLVRRGGRPEFTIAAGKLDVSREALPKWMVAGTLWDVTYGYVAGLSKLSGSVEQLTRQRHPRPGMNVRHRVPESEQISASDRSERLPGHCRHASYSSPPTRAGARAVR